MASDYRTSVEWTAPDGNRYRITEDARPIAISARGESFARVLWRLDSAAGGDGWVALAKWRSLEDGPTFGGLANIVITALNGTGCVTRIGNPAGYAENI
jgi:hypothetical protein